LEVSLVARPAHPDARLQSVSVATADVRASLGARFRTGMPVSCDRCLSSCDGVTEVYERRNGNGYHA
jgi:hypothetical protein